MGTECEEHGPSQLDVVELGADHQGGRTSVRQVAKQHLQNGSFAGAGASHQDHEGLARERLFFEPGQGAPMGRAVKE
jgi:hypothetical protein